MVGTIRIDKGGQWIEYIEKLFSGGKLQTTIVSVMSAHPRVKNSLIQFLAALIVGSNSRQQRNHDDRAPQYTVLVERLR
jgi:hypothetical protein